ncbi:hypothetical protein CLU79DRAFT_776816 [Phycomyces nitens]|nr:hypothetical protein CLU79DRAFT_776816 [Phycomyces nitens]
MYPLFVDNPIPGLVAQDVEWPQVPPSIIDLEKSKFGSSTLYSAVYDPDILEKQILPRECHEPKSPLALDPITQANEHNISNATISKGWSQARIHAYKMIHQSPNSYYYRFNAPGEEQKKGGWSKDEKAMFLKRLDQVGPNGQWGLFSTEIPGRVGYQCSNFYRLLIENREIQDPNYVLDDNGKARFLFDKKTAQGNIEKTFRTHSKHKKRQGHKEPDTSPLSTSQKKQKIQKQDDSRDTDKSYKPSTIGYKTRLTH